MEAATEIDVTFLIADLAGYTALTETHGNRHAARVVTRFVELVRAALQRGTRLAERVGDAVLVVAEDPAAAVRSAMALRDAAEREPLFPLLRIGVHRGSVVQLDDRYFGTALNLTARLAAHARPDQILCTEPITQSAGELPDVEFRALGAVRLKNIAAPVPVFQALAAHRQRGPAVVDPVCRMRVGRGRSAPAQLPFGGRIYRFCSLACARAFAEHPDRYATVRPEGDQPPLESRGDEHRARPAAEEPR